MLYFIPQEMKKLRIHLKLSVENFTSNMLKKEVKMNEKAFKNFNKLSA